MDLAVTAADTSSTRRSFLEVGDYVVIVLYFAFVLLVGLWVSTDKTFHLAQTLYLSPVFTIIDEEY